MTTAIKKRGAPRAPDLTARERRLARQLRDPRLDEYGRYVFGGEKLRAPLPKTAKAKCEIKLVQRLDGTWVYGTDFTWGNSAQYMFPADKGDGHGSRVGAILAAIEEFRRHATAPGYEKPLRQSDIRALLKWRDDLKSVHGSTVECDADAPAPTSDTEMLPRPTGEFFKQDDQTLRLFGHAPALAPHPLALEVPRPTAEERARLRDSIAKDGFDSSTPIELFQGQILDGLTRYDELVSLGLAPDPAQALSGAHPWVRIFTGTPGEAAALVRRRNYDRRQLSEAQVAMAVARELARPPVPAPLMEVLSSVSAETPRAGKTGPSLRSAARAAGVSPASVSRAAAVLRTAPDVAVAVARGDVKLREATRLAAKPAPERARELAKPAKERKREAKAAVRSTLDPRDLREGARATKTTVHWTDDDRRRLDKILSSFRHGADRLGTAGDVVIRAVRFLAEALATDQYPSIVATTVARLAKRPAGDFFNFNPERKKPRPK